MNNTKVKVKSLKWVDLIEGSFTADTPFGHYRVDEAFNTSTAAGIVTVLPTWWGPMSNAGQRCVDVETAKVAAEEDYRDRILSAIEGVE